MTSSDFSPQHFFDLSEFSHRALFENSSTVWEALKQLKNYLSGLTLGEIQVEIPSGVHIVDSSLVSIGKGTILEPGCYIQGPCVIGENCTVRQGAYIRGDLIVGNGCIIGHATEVKHSIFLNDAKAAHFAYVGDSILGNDVNLGAGTKCANLKLDKSEVYVNKSGTGLSKFGAIFGDEAQTGCNSVTNPGTLFEKGAMCYPCVNVRGVIPSREIIKSNR